MPPHPPSLACLGKSDIHVTPLLQILAKGLKSETACADHKLVESETVISSDLLTHSCGHDLHQGQIFHTELWIHTTCKNSYMEKLQRVQWFCNVYSYINNL